MWGVKWSASRQPCPALHDEPKYVIMRTISRWRCWCSCSQPPTPRTLTHNRSSCITVPACRRQQARDPGQAAASELGPASSRSETMREEVLKLCLAGRCMWRTPRPPGATAGAAYRVATQRLTSGRPLRCIRSVEAQLALMCRPSSPSLRSKAGAKVQQHMYTTGHGLWPGLAAGPRGVGAGRGGHCERGQHVTCMCARAHSGANPARPHSSRRRLPTSRSVLAGGFDRRRCFQTRR